MYIGCNSSWRAGSKPILIKKYILYCFLLCATDLTWLMLLMKIWYFEITASAQQRQSTRFFHENDHPRLPDLLCMCECELHSQVQCILSPWWYDVLFSCSFISLPTYYAHIYLATLACIFYHCASFPKLQKNHLFSYVIWISWNIFIWKLSFFSCTLK